MSAQSHLKNIATVAISTVGSRVLGLFRDILVFTLLGVSGLNSAFQIAFMIPNLFRRLLGEGALTSAVIPVLSEEETHRGDEAAAALFSKIMSRLWVLLCILVLLGAVLLYFIQPVLDPYAPRFRTGASLAILLLPYLILVCLAAMLAAALNVKKRFAIPALSQVWLNASMIAVLGFGSLLITDQPEQRILFLCWGVLLGGMLQVVIPWLALLKENWKLKLDFRSDEKLNEIKDLFVPGLLGATIFQVNIVVTRILAFALNDEGVAVLYLANRLLELPLGIFVISISTVLFPSLSRFAATGDNKGFTDAFNQGLRLVFAISIPATIGLVLLREPILHFLFVWGQFGGNDLSMIAPVLLVYATGLPFYALATLVTRVFHARKDMKTPVRLTLINFVINLLLSLFLMFPLGLVGLALANVIAMIIHCLLLLLFLFQRETEWKVRELIHPLLIVLASSLVMGSTVFVGWQFVLNLFSLTKLSSFFAVVGIIPAAGLIYAATMWILKFEDRKELMAMVVNPRR